MVAKNLVAQLVGTSWCLQRKYPRFRSPHQNYWIMKNKPNSEGNFCGQSEFWKHSRYNFEFVNHKAIMMGNLWVSRFILYLMGNFAVYQWNYLKIFSLCQYHFWEGLKGCKIINKTKEINQNLLDVQVSRVISVGIHWIVTFFDEGKFLFGLFMLCATLLPLYC